MGFVSAMVGEEFEHTFEGHTPESQQWEVVNLNAVSGKHLKDAGVWSPGTTNSFEECKDLCAKNSSCNSCDWAGDIDVKKKACGFKNICYFRSDDYWSPVPNGHCNHTAGHKVAAPSPPSPTPKPKPPLGFQPNIVFILTDDQDTRLGQHDYTDLGSLEAMPKLQQLLMKEGARMRNAFVNTPICCPSRTEFMSGRYYHNIGPPNDPGSCMHVDTTQVGKRSTGMFGQLASAGYEVGVFGKVTNDQGKILKLMTSERSMTFCSAPLNYNNFDGTTYYRDFGNGTTYTETLNSKKPIYKTVYQSTQIGNRTLDWIDSLRADKELSKKPFFAYIGPHAPHYPATPAPWYTHAFDDVTIPITPNYNLSCPDKTQHIRQNPPLTAQAKCWQDQHFRDRWASLLSVDDIIEAVVAKLEEHGLLNSTFIFYSSDHGYKQGQWRVGTSKQHPYETDIRVPLLARGPGITHGSVFEQITGNVDVTPTFLDLAGVELPKFMDGRSMLPWLISKDVRVDGEEQDTSIPWRDQWLNEYMSVGTYYNDHSHCWQDAKNTTEKCGGAMPRGPKGSVKTCKESTGVGDGNCYFVDSKHSNNWRALRIIRESENLQYIEYDPDWKFIPTGIQHYELYDIDKDPYQMENIYNQTTAEKKANLHDALSRYFECKGTVDKQSNCQGADRGSPSTESHRPPPPPATSYFV